MREMHRYTILRKDAARLSMALTDALTKRQEEFSIAFWPNGDTWWIEVNGSPAGQMGQVAAREED
jgi:hypothetical protein